LRQDPGGARGAGLQIARASAQVTGARGPAWLGSQCVATACAVAGKALRVHPRTRPRRHARGSHIPEGSSGVGRTRQCLTPARRSGTLAACSELCRRPKWRRVGAPARRALPPLQGAASPPSEVRSQPAARGPAGLAPRARPACPEAAGCPPLPRRSRPLFMGPQRGLNQHREVAGRPPSTRSQGPSFCPRNMSTMETGAAEMSGAIPAAHGCASMVRRPPSCA